MHYPSPQQEPGRALRRQEPIELAPQKHTQAQPSSLVRHEFAFHSPKLCDFVLDIHKLCHETHNVQPHTAPGHPSGANDIISFRRSLIPSPSFRQLLLYNPYRHLIVWPPSPHLRSTQTRILSWASTSFSSVASSRLSPSSASSCSAAS